MGRLIEGVWRDEWYDTEKHGGRFVREDSAFRDWVTADGGSGFKAEPGRYHLYVCYACPWAHRTLIFRKLKGLEDVISVSPVYWYMGSHGWEFNTDYPDHLNDKCYLHEVYTLAKPRYTGRVTVPTLWDKKEGTIVNNESAEIIRMLNSEFNAYAGDAALDFYPKKLRPEIDAINRQIYRNVNNGVYRTGFATTQEAYEEAFDALFATLGEVEARLARQRYLVADSLTEADWRLFTTLVRFDAVYYNHFKCNLRRIGDYPNLSGYLRDLYQVPGVADTVCMDHIKNHYYGSQRRINPTGIVPKGPAMNFRGSHGRDAIARPGGLEAVARVA
jgi:putative glutathione S-transferase